MISEKDGIHSNIEDLKLAKKWGIVKGWAIVNIN